jgi:RND family efflux transporter MFP subunit
MRQTVSALNAPTKHCATTTNPSLRQGFWLSIALLSITGLPLVGEEQGQAVPVVPVVVKNIARVIQLPGELMPYQSVFLHARVQGYVEEINVDRGSRVAKDQLLVRLSAPELSAQVAEAESKADAAESQKIEAEAQLAAAQSTFDRLKAASATDGAIAGNELIQAEKGVDAAKAMVRSRESAVRAARASIQATQDMVRYLKLSAPFDGVVTQRFVHTGALVGPTGGDTPSGALLELQELSRLRLVVAVPEADYAGVSTGARVTFRVSAHPSQTFSGVIARSAQALDPRSRTMSVELDVPNPKGALAPGMYPEVSWPVRREGPSLLVPPSSIVTTTERTFVIRVKDGRAEWVSVRRGAAAGADQIEVLGALRSGDLIVKQGTDELLEGTAVRVKQ